MRPAPEADLAQESRTRRPYAGRFLLAYALLAVAALASAGAAVRLGLGGAAPRRIAAGGCAARSDGSLPRARRADAALLAARLSDGRLTALLRGRDGLANPAFSPDGRRLAFLSNANGVTARLSVCDLARGSTSALDLRVTAGDFPLSWSRDSRRLVFLGGDEIGYGADQRPYVLDVKSRRLTDIGGDAAWYWDGAALSPDDRKLALLLALKDPAGEEPERLVVFDLATKAWVRVAGSRQVAQIDAMSWSPDGRRIVFSAYKHDDHGDLYVADVATRRIRPLLATAAGERDPAWSPDGRWIAYERSPAGRPGRTSIWLVSVSSGRTRRLTSGGSDVSPAWSPDGREVAFVRR